MLDMKAGSPQLVGGNRHTDGVQLHQNGEWDDALLCAEHEASIGIGDEFGIRFCRSFRTNGIQRSNDRALDVPNAKPDSLMHFAYAVIWRHVASASGRADRLDLGPFGDEMLDAMQTRGPYDLELIVGRNPLTVRDQRVDIAIAPYRNRMGRWNVWHFTISGLDFYLKTDRQPFPESWRPYLANNNNPIVVGQIDLRGIDQVPNLLPIFQRMQSTTWKG